MGPRTLRLQSALLAAVAFATLPSVAHAETTVLRPDGVAPGASGGWVATGVARPWRAIDDRIRRPRRPAGRAHVRPRQPGAAITLTLDRSRLRGENTSAVTAWLYTRTGPGTRLQAKLRTLGRTLARRTIRSRSRPGWRRVTIAAPPRSQRALNGLKLRLRALGGDAARVDAAYVDLHTAAFGFNEGAFLTQDVPTMAEAMDLTVAAGGRGSVIRFALDWRVVQGDSSQRYLPPERWDWGRYDSLYATARAAGVRLLPVLVAAPRWARTGSGCDGLLTGWPICPPDAAHLDEWARFAAAAADRFPDSVGVEVWNEPNYRGWWRLANNPVPSGAHYAIVFNAAARAIDHAAPRLPIVIGSLGPDPRGSEAPIGVFLDDFYDHVERDLLERRDGLGFHPYQDDPGVVTPAWDELRTVVADRDRGRGLWLTEFGVKTAGVDAVSEPAQARLLLDQLRRELLAEPNVQATLVHRLIDVPSPDPDEQGFGLVEVGLEPKPAFCRVAAFHRRPTPAGC